MTRGQLIAEAQDLIVTARDLLSEARGQMGPAPDKASILHLVEAQACLANACINLARLI